LIDDATTNSTIFVTNRGIVTSVEVDVRINHPRVSDLALHLKSPEGTRVLLAENRGRVTTNGYGGNAAIAVVTNFVERVLDDGFESADRGNFYYSAGAYPTGQRISGWRVESGNVDVVHVGLGLTGSSHTATNGVDLNGTTGGSISTNVTTVAGRNYLLTFAYCKNPDGVTPASVTAAVDVDAQPTLFTYNVANSYADPRWLGTSILVRATSTVTRVVFRSVNPSGGSGGMFIDTVRMDEVELVTNGTLYATFTDDSAKATLPIKFALPPFSETNFTDTNFFISGFENTPGGVYGTNTPFVGWQVLTNSVLVSNNAAFAYSDTNWLVLGTGSVSRVLRTEIGKEYTLQFATRAEPWRRLQLYNTGVNDNRALIPEGAQDPHYFVVTSTVPNVTGPNSYAIPAANRPAQWVGANALSRWISPDPTNNPTTPDGIVVYRTLFDMSGIPTNNARIQGRWTVDNFASIFLNGIYTGNTLPDPSYASFSPFSITNGFRRGTNVLEFVTTNIVGYNGLRVEYTQFPTNVSLGFVQPRNRGVGRVTLQDAYTNTFTALSDMWRMESLTFVARSTNTVLQFDGLVSGVWLDHIQMRDTGRKYYLPEEPLAPLLGEQSFGPWELEVWDSRLGALASGADLISWRLHLTYVRTNPPFGRLTNGTPFIGQVFTNNLAYFTVDVPCDSGLVTNTIMSLTPPGTLDLLFNQDTFPTGSQPGDVVLTANTVSNAVVLDVGTYPLLRAGRYFLAVRNNDPAAVNSYYLRTDIACDAKTLPLILVPSKTSYTASGFVLTWKWLPDATFNVQYATDPAGPWTAFPADVTSTTGEYSFTDPFNTGPGSHRYYRIILIEE
jgi:subtilisin-like proprotein convertase family protein